MTENPLEEGDSRGTLVSHLEQSGEGGHESVGSWSLAEAAAPPWPRLSFLVGFWEVFLL